MIDFAVLLPVQTIDAALASGRLPTDVLPCQTKDLKLLGAKNYSYQMKANVSQKCFRVGNCVAEATFNTQEKLCSRDSSE